MEASALRRYFDASMDTSDALISSSMACRRRSRASGELVSMLQQERCTAVTGTVQSRLEIEIDNIL